MTKGYIVHLEIFIPLGDVEFSQEGTLNSKPEIARILAEEMADDSGWGYEIKNVRKVRE